MKNVHKNIHQSENCCEQRMFDNDIHKFSKGNTLSVKAIDNMFYSKHIWKKSMYSIDARKELIFPIR